MCALKKNSSFYYAFSSLFSTTLFDTILFMQLLLLLLLLIVDVDVVVLSSKPFTTQSKTPSHDLSPPKSCPEAMIKSHSCASSESSTLFSPFVVFSSFSIQSQISCAIYCALTLEFALNRFPGFWQKLIVFTCSNSSFRTFSITSYMFLIFGLRISPPVFVALFKPSYTFV